MGLSEILARAAAQRLHVLIAEGDDAFVLRVAAQRACEARGWQLALSPADADVLLTCRPAAGMFSEAVDAVFDQMPGPRARGQVSAEHDLGPALDDLKVRYLEWQPPARAGFITDQEHAGPGQREADPHRSGPNAPEHQEHQHQGHPEPHHQGHQEHQEHQQQEHQHEPAEPESHSGHDMRLGEGTGHRHDMGHGHEMEMSGPGGIALASGAQDRDGLEMDRLHLRLGPVLPAWPAGLVVWCTLAGDVVTDVEVEQPPFRSVASGDADQVAAARLDAAAQLLSLAGADVFAGQARQARDAALARRRGTRTDKRVVSLHRRVSRSRSLRWSLHGLGLLSDSAVGGHGWPAGWAGDVFARLLGLLSINPDGVAGLVEGGEVAAALPVLLPGLEMAAARLVVASLVAHPPGQVPAARPAALS